MYLLVVFNDNNMCLMCSSHLKNLLLLRKCSPTKRLSFHCGTFLPLRKVSPTFRLLFILFTCFLRSKHPTHTQENFLCFCNLFIHLLKKQTYNFPSLTKSTVVIFSFDSLRVRSFFIGFFIRIFRSFFIRISKSSLIYLLIFFL